MTSHPDRWTAPLPALMDAPIAQGIRIGPHVFRIRISPVQRNVPGEPDTHLVHAAVTLDGRPLTPLDLGIRSPDACANVWAYLTNRVNETVVQFYTPRPRETGELNPRLGCWGPRPDLAAAGLADSDCSIAVVLGISIWLPGASPPQHDETFLESLRDTLVETITYWVVVARKQAETGAQDARN